MVISDDFERHLRIVEAGAGCDTDDSGPLRGVDMPSSGHELEMWGVGPDIVRREVLRECRR